MTTEIQTRNGFDLQVKDMGEAMQLSTMIANSQLAPKDFRGKPEDTLVAMMMGNELGLNPLQSIQNISVINGRPCVWGDALLALVQNHPSFGGIEETFDDATMTASCTVWRKKGTKHTQTFSKADAELAGLWGRNTWKQYPKRMLAMRARGFALRNQFADALLGLITAEEAQDIPVTESVKTQSIEQKFYPEDDFDKNKSSWEKIIKSGRKTADDIISIASTKGELTPKMIKEIRDCEVVEAEFEEQEKMA